MAAKKKSKTTKPEKVFVTFDGRRPNGVTKLRSEAHEWLYHGEASAVYEYRLVRRVMLTDADRKAVEEG